MSVVILDDILQATKMNEDELKLEIRHHVVSTLTLLAQIDPQKPIQKATSPD
jgi:hypothetical protein